MGRKLQRNRPSNTTSTACNHRNFAVEPEVSIAFRITQSRTLFPMKL
jgi:hypothetical protein